MTVFAHCADRHWLIRLAEIHLITFLQVIGQILYVLTQRKKKLLTFSIWEIGTHCSFTRHVAGMAQRTSLITQQHIDLNQPTVISLLISYGGKTVYNLRTS